MSDLSAPAPPAVVRVALGDLTAVTWLRRAHDAFAATGRGVRGELLLVAAAPASAMAPYLAAITRGSFAFALDQGQEQGWVWTREVWGERVALAVAIDRLRPLEPSGVAAVVARVARALLDLHDEGLAHGLVTPWAVSLTPNYERSSARLMGPVAAWALSGQDTRKRFRAPELASKEPTPRGDVYSLGLVTYQALSGVFPCEELDEDEAQEALAQGALPALSDLAPWLPQGLVRVVHGAMLPSAEARCPDMESFRRALVATAGLDLGSAQGSLRTLASRVPLTTHPGPLPRRWSEALPQASAPSEPCPPPVATAPVVRQPRTAERPPPRHAGPYTLVRLLGRGSMGEVHEARTLQGDPVAIKLLVADPQGAPDPQVRRRMVREGLATRSIHSPHVVRVLDASETAEGIPYLVMELLQGEDLGRLLSVQGPLATPLVARIFLEACEGLEAAHQQRIIHRDIKPSNLFIHAPFGHGALVKLCDFGVAKASGLSGSATTSALTATGGLLGSPVYMSPEQIRDPRCVDARSDLWSLGVSLYEALCGRRPWERRKSAVETIVTICTEKPQPLSASAPWVPPDLAAAVDATLQLDPGARPASARALAELLRPHALAGPLPPLGTWGHDPSPGS